MATRRILYFTGEDHYLYRSAGRTLELEAKFSGDDLGVTAFREHLRGQRGALFAVLADLAGEDFHEEQVPFVRGADREALLARRLAQRYRDTPLAAFVRSETQRLVQYLVTLRALPRDGSAVQVLVVAPPGQRASFEQALSSDARLLFRTVDYADALRAVKLRAAPESTAAEVLFVHLAADKPPRDQFASRDDRRRYFMWQLQRGTIAAGAAAFCACALVGGNRWLEVLNVRG